MNVGTCRDPEIFALEQKLGRRMESIDAVAGTRFCCYHSWCSGLLMAVSGSAVLRHSLCRAAWAVFLRFCWTCDNGFAIGGTGPQRRAIEEVFKLSGVGTAQISP